MRSRRKLLVAAALLLTLVPFHAIAQNQAPSQSAPSSGSSSAKVQANQAEDKEDKAGLISNLDNSFGAKLDQKGQNYTVSAASILKAYLNKDFKCSDEPWD